MWTDNWRRAALTCASRLGRHLALSRVATGKRKSRRLPRTTQRDALTRCLRSIGQWSSQALGHSREPPVWHPFRPTSRRVNIAWSMGYALKRLPSRCATHSHPPSVLSHK